MSFVITINNLSKAYKVYSKKIDIVKEFFSVSKKKYHKQRWALKNINFTVNSGEVLGIIGHNGSGKSTLLKVISGVVAPTKGSFSVKGEIGAILELSAGFNPELTGRENIDFYLSIIEYPVEKRSRIKSEIISFSELEDFMDQPLKTFSSGMRSKLAFAVNTIIEPDILILDEVFAVGDDMYRRKSFSKMESIIASGKTVLFVSHSLKNVRDVCDRVAVLDKGEMIFLGDTNIAVSLYQMLSFVDDKKEYSRLRSRIMEHWKEGRVDELLKCGGEVSVDYNPNLVSKIQQIQKFKNVEFKEISIKKNEGQKVNLLKSGEKYKIAYKIVFNENVKNVILRMNIKSENNIPISACELQVEELSEVYVGQEVEVEWEFDCILLSGSYFGNLSAKGECEGVSTVLVRIVDAIAFRVENDLKQYKDIVTLNQKLRVKL